MKQITEENDLCTPIQSCSQIYAVNTYPWVILTHSFASRYVHLLVQKMAVNVDLGFILSLVDFFSLESGDTNLEVRINTTSFFLILQYVGWIKI